MFCVEVPRKYLLELRDWAKAMSVGERLEEEYLFDLLEMGLGEGSCSRQSATGLGRRPEDLFSMS